VADVPGQEHYSRAYYRGRVSSFAHQLSSVFGLEPESVLEVGPGPGIVTEAMRAARIRVITVDLQPELGPDIAASVVDMPVADSAVDVVLCCQVLEHLPFEQFSVALSEIRRVARHGLVMSLPCSVQKTRASRIRCCRGRV